MFESRIGSAFALRDVFFNLDWMASCHTIHLFISRFAQEKLLLPRRHREFSRPPIAAHWPSGTRVGRYYNDIILLLQITKCFAYVTQELIFFSYNTDYINLSVPKTTFPNQIADNGRCIENATSAAVVCPIRPRTHQAVYPRNTRPDMHNTQ